MFCVSSWTHAIVTSVVCLASHRFDAALSTNVVVDCPAHGAKRSFSGASVQKTSPSSVSSTVPRVLAQQVHHTLLFDPALLLCGVLRDEVVAFAVIGDVSF